MANNMQTAMSLGLLTRSASQPNNRVVGKPMKAWTPNRNAASVWLSPFQTMIGT